MRNDTRTHLSRAFNDHPYYQAPIWFGPPKPHSLAILKMHFARALIHGHALWWFDMWGGWYDDADYMSFMHRAREIMEDDREKNGKACANIAFFVDEDAYNAPTLPAEARKNAKWLRHEIGLMGAPCAYYLSSDFEAVRDRYHAYIHLIPTPTAHSTAIDSYAEAHEIPLFRVTAETKEISVGQLREFCRRADIPLITDRPAVVYENTKYLFIHAAEDGTLTLPRPHSGSYHELFTGERYGNVLSVKKGESYLFRK